ncbi:HYR domain-containing protein, partial [Saprospiraceae bacterium]|nr:HYR domain-containing protein [Saprospiraceae bacterium]
ATFDDEATLTNAALDTTCTSNDPSIEGEFQPLNALSAFDGEDPNGTWFLRVSDFAFGDGGVVREFTLEITQTGGAVSFPIPETATAIPLGNQSYNAIGLDPCGPTILSYTDEVNNMDCTSPYTQVIYRTWTATDASGNEAMSCEDTINVMRTDLGSLELPRNYDDLDLSALSCTAGYPTPAVTGFPTGTFCENVQMDYEDITIDICEGSYKVLRYWTIYEWCESEVVEHTQIIKVVDNVGPSISVPTVNGPISTSPSTCTASLFIPVPNITDNCTAIPTYTVEASSGTIITQGQNYSLTDLTIGTHTVTYTAEDNCGNSSMASFTIEVVDGISPVAVCDQHTTVSLSFDDQVFVNAETFDDGSYDECSDITWAARRMSDACGVTGNTSYGSTVTFCCADVGTTVMVEFRVEDEAGNFNTCMVEVEVDDKIAPAIQVPANVTLNCQDDYTDLSLTGGMALGFDNCEIDEITFSDFPSIGSCGSGQVTRQWTVTDKSGLTASGTQFIFLQDNDPFDINDISFPGNRVITNCEASTDPSATGEPIISDDICSQVSYTFWDDKFVIVDGACEIIYRKWTVIDQCQYNANTGQGIWEDIQEIEVTNNTAPTFTTSCSNPAPFDVFGNCEGEVTLSAEAMDDCTPEDKLAYSWKIDAFNTNDGVFEFENTGKTLTATFPVGTHRIIWTVSDKCGNIETCDYLFTVRDAKAPTPYCISSLSTAVMNTNGEVTIWASDFDLGATDNCTPQNLLIPSFTENGITSSLTFTCDDIPNGIAALIEDIQIWVTDEAGNKDYCTVTLLVEDNEADFCEDLGTITASGAIYTPLNEEVKNVTLEASNNIEDNIIFDTGENGIYSFDLIPNFNYEIVAEKNFNFINGITTLDIVLIQKHILGLEVFDSPYKTIAADTDNNGQISGSDIIAIRKMILGHTDVFPNDQHSWRFVDQTAEFDDVYAVFPYDEVLDVNFTTGSNLNNDFYGVKIGDVNQSASPAEFTSNVDTRSGNTLDLLIDNQTVTTGQIVEIPVFAENFKNMVAYQMTVEFDVTRVAIRDLKAGALAITDENFNMTRLSEGLFSTAWDVTEALTTSEALFTIVVEAKKAGDLTNLLRTSNRITETVAYDRAHTDSNIKINVRDNDGVIPTVEAFVLYQNTPNPFNSTTMIAFEMPKAAQVVVSIYDMNGVLVKTITQAHGAGYNTIEVNRNELQASGVYYYNVNAGDHASNGKMILID